MRDGQVTPRDTNNDIYLFCFLRYVQCIELSITGKEKTSFETNRLSKENFRQNSFLKSAFFPIDFSSLLSSFPSLVKWLLSISHHCNMFFKPKHLVPQVRYSSQLNLRVPSREYERKILFLRRHVFLLCILSSYFVYFRNAKKLLKGLLRERENYLSSISFSLLYLLSSIHSLIDKNSVLFI